MGLKDIVATTGCVNFIMDEQFPFPNVCNGYICPDYGLTPVSSLYIDPGINTPQCLHKVQRSLQIFTPCIDFWFWTYIMFVASRPFTKYYIPTANYDLFDLKSQYNMTNVEMKLAFDIGTCLDTDYRDTSAQRNVAFGPYPRKLVPWDLFINIPISTNELLIPQYYFGSMLLSAINMCNQDMVTAKLQSQDINKYFILSPCLQIKSFFYPNAHEPLVLLPQLMKRYQQLPTNISLIAHIFNLLANNNISAVNSFFRNNKYCNDINVCQYTIPPDTICVTKSMLKEIQTSCKNDNLTMGVLQQINPFINLNSILNILRSDMPDFVDNNRLKQLGMCIRVDLLENKILNCAVSLRTRFNCINATSLQFMLDDNECNAFIDNILLFYNVPITYPAFTILALTNLVVNFIPDGTYCLNEFPGGALPTVSPIQIITRDTNTVTFRKM